MRTLSPDRTTEPSTKASTPNSCAISGAVLCVPAKTVVEVCEITRSELIWARFVMSSSVTP
jgi:hypothetical protein